ncbi:hypothetical protein Tcan_02856 [Toxocara canis]|uniref:Uncharacterized protein n=1 Tax=Toxocara canis TaxID=6265 RepID=A0A0B2VBP7_TOXCA|nr:hypothetical protein Tcan_02856 [Toxocara canis]
MKKKHYFYENDSFPTSSTKLDSVNQTPRKPDAAPHIIPDLFGSISYNNQHGKITQSLHDDNTEVRALVVDDIEGMVPRIITNLGKAAFWMDKRPTETILATNSSP